MKSYLLSFVLLSILSAFAIADEFQKGGETISTECEQMNDGSVRNNPKANISAPKPKSTSASGQ